MLTFRCPACNTSIPLSPGLRTRFSRQWRRGKRQCPRCAAWLELDNSFSLSLAYGLMLAITVIGLGDLLPWSNDWDWRVLGAQGVLAVVLGFAFAPLLVRRFGRWRALADGYHDSPGVTRWSRARNTGLCIAVAVLFLTVLLVLLEVRQVLSRLPAVETAEMAEALTNRSVLLIGTTFGAGLALSAVCVVVSIRAERRRQRAREAEH